MIFQPIPVYVPEGKVADYKAANEWKDFGDNIQEMAPTGMESIQPSEISHQKILRDGKVFILRGGKVYTVTGQEVR